MEVDEEDIDAGGAVEVEVGGMYYAGTVTRPEGCDKYTITLDGDGSVVTGVHRRAIRKPQVGGPAVLAVGTSVDARWAGGGYYSGVVIVVEGGDLYTVVYDDLSEAEHVPRAHLRVAALDVGGGGGGGGGRVWDSGEVVQARRGGGPFTRATIVARRWLWGWYPAVTHPRAGTRTDRRR